jgi:membrane protein YqaA with SNARE-associated domain
MAVLAPLGGPWAVFIIALLDAAALGIPMDPIIAYYVHAAPQRLMLYAVLGAVGGSLGSTVPYLLGYKGGEAFLIKKIGEKKFQRVHGLSERYGDLALIIPAMLPPPTPFKMFVFSAGVAEMGYPHFLLSIFAGRLLRFLVLGALTIRFGPEVVEITQTLGALVAIGLAIWLGIKLAGRWGNSGAELTA